MSTHISNSLFDLLKGKCTTSDINTYILSEGEKISTIQKEKIIALTKEIFKTAIIVKNNPSDETYIEIHTTLLSDHIYNKYKYFTTQELDEIVRRGFLGEFKERNDDFYISAELVAKWVERYNKLVRIPARANVNNQLDKLKTQRPLNQQEGNERMLTIIRNYYMDFKNGVPYEQLFPEVEYKDLYAELLYNSLYKQGKIDLTEDEKKAIAEKVGSSFYYKKSQDSFRNFFRKSDPKAEMLTQIKDELLKFQFEKWKQKHNSKEIN